jgi:hypothetical protein
MVLLNHDLYALLDFTRFHSDFGRRSSPTLLETELCAAVHRSITVPKAIDVTSIMTLPDHFSSTMTA